MASYVDNGNKLDWALPFQRTGNFPIDRSSMFSSYADAVKYAKGDSTDPDSRGLQGSSYVGQIITVYENDVVNVYKIDANRNLSAIGSGGGGGGTSDYSELENKPSINNVTLVGNKTSNDLGLQPAGDYALRSEIPDVSNFITVTVDNLVNYYLKSETYNKQEVNSLISAISTATFELVNELPQTGESNVIYLVPSSNPGTQNVKDEYIWINNSWEQIGSTSVDLTGYATETWVNTQIANFLTQAQIELLINTAIANVNTSINDINSKIPNQASVNNQLADKDFVNSSISTATATFRGTFTSLNTLQAAEGDRNDYAFYSHQDSSGNTIYDRYKYVGPKEVVLPAGYTQVSRIAGNYINLNILPRNDWHFILKVSSPYFANWAPAVPVFGVQSGDTRYDMYKPSYENPLFLKTTVGQWGIQVSNNDIHTIEVKSNRAMYIDGSLVATLGSTTNLPTIPVYLLGVNSNGSAWKQNNVHCYGLTIYDNEENLLMDLVPCIRDQDGSIGVYDLAGTINPDTNSPFYGGATSSSPLSEDKWEYEYSLSNLNLTTAQWATLNSGLVEHITSNGFDATKTQVLKNINGTLTWVDET